MECEVMKGGDEAGEAHQLSGVEEEVQSARDLLLLTSFSACLDTCHRTIAAIKAWEDRQPGTPHRLDRLLETVTVIAIQAYAEQGTWREVIPFVEQVYTHVAACPPAIMQMCLLLHAHVREYLVCHSLVDGWLDWDDHCHTAGSAAVVSTYITNVLVPLGAFNLIPQIVERCMVLSSEERQTLLSPRAPSTPTSSPRALCGLPCQGSVVGQTTTDSSLMPLSDVHACVGKEDGSKPKRVGVMSLYLRLTRKLWQTVAKTGWCQRLRSASKMFVLISFILLALLHAQTDVTANFTRAIEIWKTAVGALYNMWRQPSNGLQ